MILFSRIQDRILSNPVANHYYYLEVKALNTHSDSVNELKRRQSEMSELVKWSKVRVRLSVLYTSEPDLVGTVSCDFVEALSRFRFSTSKCCLPRLSRNPHVTVHWQMNKRATIQF